MSAPEAFHCGLISNKCLGQVQEMKKKKGGKDKKKGESADKPAAAPEDQPAAEEKPAKDEKAETEEKSTTEEKADTEEKPAPEEESDELPPMSPAASLAQQSKARSASFRKPSIPGPLSPGGFSPEGETAPDIYRKHVARIEELEMENKRLAKEAGDAEKRWQKAEDELAVLREGDGDASGDKTGASAGEVEKLVSALNAS